MESLKFYISYGKTSNEMGNFNLSISFVVMPNGMENFNLSISLRAARGPLRAVEVVRVVEHAEELDCVDVAVAVEIELREQQSHFSIAQISVRQTQHVATQHQQLAHTQRPGLRELRVRRGRGWASG